MSAAFEKQPILTRHRMINALLDEEFKVKGLHALSIAARTPEEQAKKEVVE